MVVVAGLAMLAPVIGRFVLRLRRNEDRDEAAFDAFKVVLGMAALVLSFSLAQANASLHNVESMVGREASAFSAVDRSLLRYGTAEAASIRPLLAQYGRSRIDVEYPGLAQGDRNQATDLLYNNLSRTARLLQPADQRQQTLFSELLKNLDDLSETREVVIASADTALSGIFWIMSGGLLVIGIGLASLTDLTLPRTLTVGATATAVALLFAFVVVTDRPFVGDDAVSPAPIGKILALNARRV